MQKINLCIAIAMVFGCQSPFENSTANQIEPGNYRGYHGKLTDTYGIETELVLNTEGTFRYFFIEQNTAFQTFKGNWHLNENEMILTRKLRSSLYHGGFRVWDTLETPDTTYLRKVTSNSFERLEVTYDTLFNPIAKWIQYQLFPQENTLSDGNYEFRESFKNGVDTTIIDSAITFLSIYNNKLYTQNILINGEQYMSDTDSSWTQVGSFLITSKNNHCEYEPGYSHCMDASPGYEYIARLTNIHSSHFQLWLAPGYTFQPEPLWADFILSKK